MDDDNGLTDIWVRTQRGLDLGRLDAKSAQLDLVILTAQIVERAVRSIAGAISGPVQPHVQTVTDRRMDKAFGRQLRPIAVPPGQCDPFDIQIAGMPDRHRLQVRIQHVYPGIRDRAADRD